jgi:CrcB protein
VPVLPMLAIFFGAGLGALMRWGLSLALNPLVPLLPLGTLTANAVGGLLMGIALGLFDQFESLPPVWRLAITTGFLGGLTTFSTYSAEAMTLLVRGEYRWACLHTFAHVGISLLATFTGFLGTQALFRPLGGTP